MTAHETLLAQARAASRRARLSIWHFDPIGLDGEDGPA
jgi:hypothetical protein